MNAFVEKAGEVSVFLFKKAIHFRYLIALVLFIVLVLLKVNGSSVACWEAYLGQGQGKSSVVAGTARPIRSDEWGVLTPFIMAQGNSDTPYSLVNTNVALSGHNMLVTLGMPVKDIYSISKPLNWGFLLFGTEYGLSWYWNMKLLLILLLSFELCMIITKQNEVVAALGAFWLAFSPAVQWWFAQHVGDILLYMEAIIVTFYYFLKADNTIWRKLVFASLFALSCLGYLFPLYPPFQITFGYLALVIMAVILIDMRKKIVIHKADVLIICGTAVFMLLMLFHVYWITKDALTALVNTVYPGQRESASGHAPIYFIYSYLTNIFLPYRTINIANNCEMSSFFNFLPAVVLALPFLIRKKTGNLKFGIPLVVFSLFFLLYMYCEFPPIFSRIALLNYVTVNRVVLAYSLSAALASIWALSEISRFPVIHRYFGIFATVLIGVSYVWFVKYTDINGYVRLRFYLAFILVLMVLNYLFLRGHKRMFAGLMFCVVIMAGATVNPINIGLGTLYSSSLSEEIRAVDQKKPDALWIASDKGDPMAAIGILIYANGAKSLGGINNFPDYKKWSVIDPDGSYNDIYNRSAHVTFEITNEPSSFVLTSVTTFLVKINVNDLKKYDIEYVITKDQLETFDNNTVTFEMVYPANVKGYAIYHVSYH